MDTWLLFFHWLFTLVSIEKACFPLLQHRVVAVGVVLTSTRIGLGITVLMYTITLAILLLARRKQDLLKIGLVGILTVLLAFAVLNQGEQKNSVAGAKNIIIQKTKTVSADLSTLNTRTDIWKNALNAFRHSPIAGYGAGSFEYAYRKYFDGNSYTGVAHSTLVKIAVELGHDRSYLFLFLFSRV